MNKNIGGKILKKTNTELMITSKLAKMQIFSSKAILLTVAIIMIIIGLFAIHTTVFFNLVINFASETCFFKTDNIFFNLLFCIITLLSLYFIYKKILPKISEKTILIILIIISLCLGFFWVNYIKFRPLADQSMLVYCAECLLNKDVTTILEPGEYLNRNPHQLGCILYIMTAFKLFNNTNPLTLQNLNVLYSVINAILLYLICRELFKEAIVRKISLLLIGFFSVYWTFFAVHVYGNIPGLMFGLLALLFTLKYLDKTEPYKLVIIAISITLAYMLKSNYEIFLCAILIVLVLKAFQTKQKTPIIGAIVILIAMFSFKSLIYTIIEKNTGYSLDTGVDMTAYIYMGIAEPNNLSPGWYTADVEVIYNEANFDKETSKTISQDLLINRVKYLLTNLDYTFRYFESKLKTTWLNPTFQVFWCSTPSTLLDIDPAYNNNIAPKRLLISILTGTAFKIEERILDVYQIITFIFAGIGLINCFKTGSLKHTLLPLTFLGGFIFHIIWETKSIYVIQYFYMMLPFAAYGLYQIFIQIDKYLKKQNKAEETPSNIIYFKKK